MTPHFAKIEDDIFTPEARKAIGQAVWMYAYLKRHEDWKTGVLFRKDRTIANVFGNSEKTISRWRKKLIKARLIQAKFTSRYFVYQTGQKSPQRVDKNEELEKTKTSTRNIYTPSNKTPIIYSEDEIKLSKQISEWGINRANNPSTSKTPEEYAQMVLPYIKRHGIDVVLRLYSNETDNKRFWNNLRELG